MYCGVLDTSILARRAATRIRSESCFDVGFRQKISRSVLLPNSSPGMHDEDRQQLKFLRGQMRFHASDPDSVHNDVDDEMPDADRCFRLIVRWRHERIGYVRSLDVGGLLRLPRHRIARFSKAIRTICALFLTPSLAEELLQDGLHSLLPCTSSREQPAGLSSPQTHAPGQLVVLR